MFSICPPPAGRGLGIVTESGGAGVLMADRAEELGLVVPELVAATQVDLRYHWTRQKRFQGSHGTNDAQATAYNDLVVAGKIDPVLGRTLAFDDIGNAHADMGDGVDVRGNVAFLVGAAEPGTGRE